MQVVRKINRKQKSEHTLKLSGQQIPQPPLQQWSDPPHEEQPDSPARSPEATTWTFAHWTLSGKKKRNVLTQENTTKAQTR